jgi:tetratricopeptide (TPR) repeat protein
MSRGNNYRAWLLSFLLGFVPAAASTGAEAVLTNIQTGEMLIKEGEVHYRSPARTETAALPPQPLGFGDALRTLRLARATVRFADWSELRMRELTRLHIQQRQDQPGSPGLRLEEGQVYFANRGPIPKSIPIETPHVRGAPKGTEFLVSVDANQTEVTMFDGEVELQGPADLQPLRVRSGEQGLTVAGQPTVVRPLIQAQNIVQWWIYYPGLLDPDELGLTAAEQAPLAASLTSYRAGDLQEALKQFPGYPAPAEPTADRPRAYLAGLFLAVGAVDRAEGALSKIATPIPPGLALRTMIDAVQHKSGPRPAGNGAPADRQPTASELLALSYTHQSTNNLTGALAAARRAVAVSPRFGFGWARVGELEFSFGRTRAAHEAADRASELSPRNAQAHTLQGFLLAAENHYQEALAAFERAIALDPALGNAWLGRGLCRIRQGRSAEGRADLQTAAILEPNRSVIRSYAGKAFSDANNARLARKELDYARKLDETDPTPWLYSALEHWQEHRFNEAVEEIEQSIARNDNRALFRSRLLLDQDLAVRSASLARVYQNAGLGDVSLREAARAVSHDYGNFSAHLFLSESFEALRDPTRFNLRYETPWFNELLLANLLSPVGGTPLSQNISQQEYARLFDQDRIGIFNSTEYRSDGQFRELASQFGSIGQTAWSLDLDYQHNEGVRVNNELDRIEWYSTLKQQLTPQDSILFLTKYQDYHSGDNFQYFYPTNARPHFQFDEEQKPIALAGYHHEWQPGVHTLLLAGRLENEQRFSDQSVLKPILITNGPASVSAVLSQPFDENYRSRLEIYTAELNQIYQQERHSFVFGGRFQAGKFHTTDQLISSLNPGDAAFYPPVASDLRDTFERVTGYGYYTLEVIDHLQITAGVTYDRIRFPENLRHAPLSPGSIVRDRVSPKAALVWSVIPELTLRGMFSQGLGGVSLDESFRLEPSQLAGFSQSFRSVIPEPAVGSVAAPANQIAGAAADLKLGTHTYAGLQAASIQSRVRQTIGAFNFNADVPPSSPAGPTGTREHFNYDEQSLGASAQQLLSQEWSLGVSSQWTRSVLNTIHPDLPETLPEARHRESAQLLETAVFALYNHSSGFFGRAEGHWYRQKNSDYPTSDFYQVHLFLGWRFPRRHGDVTFGVLNLNDTDYHLNPLNLHPELARERTFVGRVTFTF